MSLWTPEEDLYASVDVRVVSMRIVDDDIWGPLNIFAEARGEPYEGQIAVGNVVRERMRLQYASDGTVAGTVWRRRQFSWTNESDSQRARVLAADDMDPAWIEARKAWEESAVRQAVPAGTVLYHASHIRPYWADKVDFVRRIGEHLFYRDPQV